MRGLFTRIAIAGALAVLLPATYASAQCTNLANSTDVACKNAQLCQDTILKAAAGYSKDVMFGARGLILKSQKGIIGSEPFLVCSGGSNAGNACLSNTGVCKKNPKGATCSVDADCDGSAGSCDTTKGCPGGECVANAAKNPGSKDAAKAKAKLEAAIQKKCIDTAVAAADLGLSSIPYCDPAIDGTASNTLQFQSLAACIEQSVGGDLSSGAVVDTVLAQIARSLGTGGSATRPQSKPGTVDSDPRLVAGYQGSNLLQIGSGAGTTAPTISGGGTVTYTSLASCTGGNGNTHCVNNKDCGTDSSGIAGTCGDNCSGDTCAGTGLGTVGNTLTITGTCAGGTATCLHTKVQDAGNGTPAVVTVDLGTGLYESHAPIATDVYLTGLGVTCGSYAACPTCVAGVCTGRCSNAPNTVCTTNATCGAGTCTTVAGTCTTADNTTTSECLPNAPLLGTIPNPFDLSTNTGTLTPIASTATNIFCGFCDTNAASGCQGGASVCAKGCQDAGDCTSVGGTVCDVSGSGTGASWNPGAFFIQSNGVASQYAPVIAGAFCTGITGNPLVDGVAGLPGPVSFISQDIHAYGFTKDH